MISSIRNITDTYSIAENRVPERLLESLKNGTCTNREIILNAEAVPGPKRGGQKYNYLGASDMMRLVNACLEGNITNLQSLELRGNQIGPKGMRFLSKLNLSNLTLLTLGGNNIGDAGAEALSTISLPLLSELHIGINNIGDSGIKAISQMNLLNLKKLDICENKITSDGGKFVFTMDFPNLTTLYIDYQASGPEKKNLEMLFAPKLSEVCFAKRPPTVDLRASQILINKIRSNQRKPTMEDFPPSGFFSQILRSNSTAKATTTSQSPATGVVVKQSTIPTSITPQVPAKEKTTQITSPIPNQQRAQGQASVLSAYQIELLKILGDSSPETLIFLKNFGENEVEAKKEYDHIAGIPALKEHYLTFNRILSSTLRAFLVIYSEMVKDDRTSASENVMSAAHALAQGSNLPGVPLITGVASFFLSSYEERKRKLMVNRIAVSFSVDKTQPILVEALARKLTLQKQKEILASGSSSTNPLYEYARKTVDWVQANDVDTNVKRLASDHVATIIKKILAMDPSKALGLEDLSLLISWTKDAFTKETSNPATAASSNTSTPEKNAEAIQDLALSDELAAQREENLRMKAAMEKQARQIAAVEKKLHTIAPEPSIPQGTGGLVSAFLPKPEKASREEKTIQDRQMAMIETQVELLTTEVIRLKEKTNDGRTSPQNNTETLDFGWRNAITENS